jgi:hypothetical protein
MATPLPALSTPLSGASLPDLHPPQIAVLPRPTAPQPPGSGSPIETPAATERRSAKKVRNGKIARLPKPERDMVNRMLQNNLPYRAIVGALDEIGIRVTPRNVSNWKTRGGYREWCLEQEHALQVRLRQDNLTDYLRTRDASEVPEVGLQLAGTSLSEFLTTPEARQQLASDPDKYFRMVATLCRLTNQVHTLQKYRDDSAKQLGYKHDPERIKREDEECLESVRKTYSSKIGEGPKDPDIPHRNYMPKNY